MNGTRQRQWSLLVSLLPSRPPQHSRSTVSNYSLPLLMAKASLTTICVLCAIFAVLYQMYIHPFMQVLGVFHTVQTFGLKGSSCTKIPALQACESRCLLTYIMISLINLCPRNRVTSTIGYFVSRLFISGRQGELESFYWKFQRSGKVYR